MKKFIKNCIVAFSMYSKIPMPKINWNKENMCYAYAFFPLIGVCIGVLEWIWRKWCDELSLSALLYAAVATVLPILITGGIHLDGFLDTTDAIASYAPREKKLAILKDPHTGAFSIIYLGVLLLLDFGFWGQATNRIFTIAMYLVPFVMARCIGALLVLRLPSATGGGTAHTFSQSSDWKTIVVLIIWMVLSAALLIWAYAMNVFIILLLASIVVFGLSKYFKREFGGITGDLAGFAITICERIILYACIAF